MRSWIVAGIGLLLVIGFAMSHWMRVTTNPNSPSLPAAQEVVLDTDLARRAEEFLDLLDAQKYDEAVAMTTPDMVRELGDGKLRGIWQALPRQLGQRRHRGEPRGQQIEGHDVVTERLQFKDATLDARVVFDHQQRIAGFQLVPAGEVSAAPTSNRHFSERSLNVVDESATLPATLSMPNGAGPFAGVVLVHGSGPQDRDGTLGPNKPFRDLAHGLAERGIAVLRYEKRSTVDPAYFATRNFTVDDETVNDALAAVKLLRSQTNMDGRRIFVAGHSLGAMMAPRIGQRDKQLAGLILLAAPANRFEDIILRQTRYLAKLEGHGEEEIAQALVAPEGQARRIKQLDWFASDKSELFFGVPASYWLDLNHYDPIELSLSLNLPMLILQGGRDYQVTKVDEFALWQAAFPANPRVKLIEYPSLGHTFMQASEPPGPNDYKASSNVELKVVDDIASWIRSVK